MKYILFILLSITINAQSNLLLLFDSGTTTPPASYTTDNLIYYWDYSTLADGFVTSNEWEDINSVPFTTASSDPDKSVTGIAFDGNDDVNRASPNITSGGISFDMIVSIGDTTGNQGLLAMVYNNATTPYGLCVNYRNPADVADRPVIAVTSIEGATITYSDVDYKDYLTGLHHLVITWDGATSLKVYIDGTLGTQVSTYLGSAWATDLILFGYNAGGFIGNLKRIMIYSKELNSTEVTDNYNHALDEL